MRGSSRTSSCASSKQGDLLGADADAPDTVLAYVRQLGNAYRTAARLYTHRNTVLRRRGGPRTDRVRR